MKKDVFVVGSQMVTALGISVEESFQSFESKNTGVKLVDDHTLSDDPLYLAKIDWKRLEGEFEKLGDEYELTRFEKLLIYTAKDAVSNIDPSSPDTLFVISTTKANIDLLDPLKAANFPDDRINLWAASNAMVNYFGNPNKPITISNACVSGVMAINIGAQYIASNKYKNVVVIGGDTLSKFVVSGFQSFQSLSSGVCKPFDRNRDGLSLGEAAGCMVLSSERGNSKIKVLGGANHNDANHISGPSRTAEGFYNAATDALKASGLEAKEIEYISTHGTATPYNDQMEAFGIDRLELGNVPVHSLKGFWGHCLGAAGVIESIALIESMNQGLLLPTYGYENHGVDQPVNVIKDIESRGVKYALKLASGFSGINSSLIFENMGGDL